MFIVMGLYWIMDVLSFHVHSQNMFWTIVDFITTLQGVFIFIIFICNKRALKILNKRFLPRKNISKQNIPLTNVQITRSTWETNFFGSKLHFSELYCKISKIDRNIIYLKYISMVLGKSFRQFRQTVFGANYHKNWFFFFFISRKKI